MSEVDIYLGGGRGGGDTYLYVSALIHQPTLANQNIPSQPTPPAGGGGCGMGGWGKGKGKIGGNVEGEERDGMIYITPSFSPFPTRDQNPPFQPPPRHSLILHEPNIISQPPPAGGLSPLPHPKTPMQCGQWFS